VGLQKEESRHLRELVRDTDASKNNKGPENWADVGSLIAVTNATREASKEYDHHCPSEGNVRKKKSF